MLILANVQLRTRAKQSSCDVSVTAVYVVFV